MGVPIDFDKKKHIPHTKEDLQHKQVKKTPSRDHAVFPLERKRKMASGEGMEGSVNQGIVVEKKHRGIPEATFLVSIYMMIILDKV